MKAIRWIGRGLAAVGLLLLLAYGGVYARTEWLARRHVTLGERRPLPTIARTDTAVLARGRHLSDAVAGCVHCHGEDFGGDVLVDLPIVLRLAAPNLTRGAGGVIDRYDDAALERAIRGGVAHDGRVLRLMPSNEYAHMADDDVAAIIADLRARAPVDRQPPPFRVGPLGRLLTLTGDIAMFPYDRIDQAKTPPRTAPLGRTVERGRYLAEACSGCHKPDFAGGRIGGAPPEWPPAANLTPTGIGSWTDAQFVTAMRQGVRPDGSRIDTAMPWKQLGRMSDDELLSLRWYLKTVPPRPTRPS
ncbi:MAG: cytochrome c [Gemmatimonadaceae bacterium]|jgi:cytochrome c553|nr:cytochrome c [Gemmatimonadaceae bacterium]